MIKDYIWVDTKFGFLVFEDQVQFNKFKNRGDEPEIKAMGTYTAEDIAEVYAVKNAEKLEGVLGVGGSKPIDKKDARYWRDVRRKRFGRWVDTGEMQTFHLTASQMAAIKAGKAKASDFTFAPEKSVKIIGRQEAIKNQKMDCISSLSGIEKRKAINKTLGIAPPRETKLPPLSWQINGDTIRILGVVWGKEEGLRQVQRFYPLDYEEISKSFKA